MTQRPARGMKTAIASAGKTKLARWNRSWAKVIAKSWVTGQWQSIVP